MKILIETKLLFIAAIILCHFSVVAQDQRSIDSLLQVLEGSISEEDRVNVFISLTEELHNSDSAIHYANKAILLSEKINYNLGRTRGLFKMGEEYTILQEFEKADSIFQNILDQSQKTDFKEGLALGYAGLGIVFYHKFETDQSLENLNLSIGYFKQIDNKSVYARILETQGKNHLRIGQYEKALEFITQALNLYQELHNQSGISDAYNLTGIVYQEQGDLLRGLDYFMKATNGDIDAASFNVLNNIANVYNNLGEDEKCLEYYKKSLEVAQKSGSTKDLIVCYLNLGLTYQDLSELQKALQYHLEALKLFENYDNPMWFSRANNDIGYSYSLLGEHEKALDHFSVAVKIMTDLGDKMALVEAYDNMAEII